MRPRQEAQWPESHGLAVASAYAGVPADGPPPKVDQKYGAGPVIDRQLQRAGVRLATILNDVFR